MFARRFLLQWQKCSKRILLTHVRRIAVENAAHFYDRTREIDLFAKNFRAIRRRKNGSADIKAHLAAINIERGHDFDVTGPIRTDLAVHKPDARAIGGGALVKVYSLDKRTGTVTYPNNSDSDLSHFEKGNPTRSQAVEASYKVIIRPCQAESDTKWR